MSEQKYLVFQFKFQEIYEFSFEIKSRETTIKHLNKPSRTYLTELLFNSEFLWDFYFPLINLINLIIINESVVLISFNSYS